MKREKRTFLLMLLCSSLLLSACGSDSDDDNNQIQQEQQADEGNYYGSFESLNPGLAPDGKFKSSISVNDNTIRISVEGDELPINSTHQQFIYSGNACPGQEADRNGDGIIDYQELLAEIGPILIPLDNDISSQNAGTQFPRSNARGNLTYTESASLVDVVSDLRGPDTSPDDDLGKLGPDERLNLGGRVLVIHGVDRGVTLPATVASKEGLSAAESLPIACSVIERGEAAPDEEQVPPEDSEEDQPREDSFSTRLNSELLISGKKCDGGNCPQGKWLVIVDNVNTCSPDGACTEIGVNPIEAELRKADITSPTTLSFYHIIPNDSASEEQKDILEDHWVRFDLNSEPRVLEKD